MNGVEILNKIPIMQGADWCENLIWIGALVGFIVGIALMIRWIIDFGWDWSQIFAPVLFAFAGAMLGVLGWMLADCATLKPTGEYEYQVVVSNEVNFNEFNERYEVIEQDGKIWTVKERE